MMNEHSQTSSEQPIRKRARKAINCEPCRLHKLKCNRARPCSGCVMRGTQSQCYAGEEESGRENTAAPDPLTELSQLQRSVTGLQNYYRAQRSHGNASPDPEAVAAHDMLLNGLDGDGYYVGATWEATPLMKYFKGYDTEPKEPLKVPRLEKFTCRDLLPQLPSKQILQQLTEMYLTAGTWLYSYLDVVELKRKVDRFVNGDELDDITLATFFAICSVGLYYTPWPHNLLNAFPEPAMITGDRFHTLSLEVLERRNDEWIRQPTLEFLELHLLMAHYYNSAKRADAGEDMWNLSGKMIGIATALGLHRDPEHWGMSPEVAARRRWAWWNVLSFERCTCILLGRLPSLGNNAFDTQFPMPDFQQPGQLAVDDPTLPYLCIFRFTLFVGQVLEDAYYVKPMTFETVNAHDQALIEWQTTWPSDLRLDEFGIAYAMSRNASEDMVRRGVQCMYLYGLFNLTRLYLNRPTAITTSKEAAIAHDRMAGAAAKLIAMHARATPDYVNNAVLTVPGHLGHAPYNLFAASMFYTHQLLSNPDQPGTAHFRSNLSEGISTFGKVREMPIADRCFKILVACHPPPEADSEENQQVRRQRIAAVRRVTFPYLRLADVADLEHIYPVVSLGDAGPIAAKPEVQSRSTYDP